MTEARRTFIGVLPSGYADTFVDGPDPVAEMLAAAIRKADLERAAEERARQVAAADAARLVKTRKARHARRLRRALTALGFRGGRR